LNLRQTAEIAALASAYSAHLIEGTQKLPDAALHRFWNQTKQRLHVWLRCLNRYQADLRTTAPAERRVVSKQVEPVIEEVFVSEILIRVWSAVLTAADHRRSTNHAEPIARSVLLGQLKARQLAMRLMVNCPHELLDRAALLDRLRRKTERWTDLLLGHLVVRYPVVDFAFDERRARDFGSEQLASRVAGPDDRVWDLILAGLRLAFPIKQTLLATDSGHGCQIVRSVLSTFPADAFMVDGPFKSVLHGRIDRSGIHPEESPLKSVPRSAGKTRTEKRATSSSTSRSISFADLRRRGRPNS